MAFSTWSDLHTKMLNDFASGNWRTKSYDFDGMRKEFVSPKEFLETLEYVKRQAASEEGSFPLRTIARGANR